MWRGVPELYVMVSYEHVGGVDRLGNPGTGSSEVVICTGCLARSGVSKVERDQKAGS